MRMELTDDVVAKLKPRNQKYDATAAGYPGFGVRIHPSGVKTWFYRYRIKDSVRMMRLGRTSYTSYYAAMVAYRRARKLRLLGRDPQGAHPVNQEAFYVLFDIWDVILNDGGLPDTLGETPSLEDFAAHFKVSVAAINKLAVYGCLTLREKEGMTVVVPLWYAIRHAVEEGEIGLI
jgi:hypothetical protein